MKLNNAALSQTTENTAQWKQAGFFFAAALTYILTTLCAKIMSGRVAVEVRTASATTTHNVVV